MRSVNLLPADAYATGFWAGGGGRGATKRALIGSGAAVGLAVALLGGAVVYESGVVNDRRDTLAQVEQQLAVAEADAAAVRAAQASAQARLAAVKAVASQRVAWETVLTDLADVLPENVRLQTLQATKAGVVGVAAIAAPAPAAGAAVPTGFTVTGSAGSQRDVAQVLDRLALLPWLSDVTLQGSTRGETETGSEVQFTIGANLSSTGGQR
jgi:Tfp pilus assembly protein PilN